jgi:dTDP-4-dehydrorhamnose reductase
MSVLVIGRSGQLATHLKSLLPEAIFWGREEVNWQHQDNFIDKLVSASPSAIINTTAYTAVDKAETDRQAAWSANVEGPHQLATAAALLGVRLVHVSTDYVFDGKSDNPYSTNHGTNPINVYGATKLAGELAVTTCCPDHVIIRTSWVFSENGSNFLKTMLRLGKERDQLNIVGDQIGRPTYAGHLAQVVAKVSAASAVPSGLYHLSGGDSCSWFEFAQQIFDQALKYGLLEKAPELKAIATADYPTPAPRPIHSVLAPSEALAALSENYVDWRKGLAEALHKLNNAPAA